MNGPSYIRVAWDDFVTDPVVNGWSVRHRALKDPPSGAWSTSTGIAASARSRTIADLDPGTAYEIQLRASNTDGDGSWSTSATISTQEDDDMTVLQSDFTVLQAAKEATGGTKLASVVRVPYADASVVPMIERKTLQDKGTVLADTADVVVGRRCELSITEELNTETILLPLSCGLADVAHAGGTWTYTPSVTQPSNLATANWQWAATDGASSPDTYDGQTTFARPTRIGIEASAETAQLSCDWVGRAKEALATATDISAPSRWVIPAQAFTVSVDDSWGTLGNTKWAEIRSFNLDIETGLEAAPVIAGRASLDFEYWRRNRIGGTLTMVCDHDDRGTAELAKWEDGSLRYVRLQADNGGSGGGKRELRIDVVGRYIESPDVLSMDGGQMTLDLALAIRADSAGNILRVLVDSGITAI